jgi:hypothetical protein
MSILLDTNILTRAAQPGHPMHQPAVDAVLAAAACRPEEGAMSKKSNSRILRLPRIVAPSLVPKLWTCDDHFDEAAKGVVIGDQLSPHFIERLFVR